MKKSRQIQKHTNLNAPTYLLIATAILSGCATVNRDGGRDSSERNPSSVTEGVSTGGPSYGSATDAKTDASLKAGLVQSDPKQTAEYHFSMAQAYVSEGNPDRAIEEFKLTLTYDPDSALVYTRLATEYVKKGSFGVAMEAAKTAIEKDPGFLDAHLILAGLYSSNHESGLALKEYDQVLKANPKHEEALIYRSQLLIEDGRPQDATASLHAFLKKNPESTLAWYYLGKSEWKAEHHAEAIRALKKSVELRPAFSQAALTLGFLYETDKKMDEAAATYRSIYDLTQDATAAARLSTLYLKQEKFELAIPYLEAMQQADPEDMNVRVKLGLVYMEQKKFPAAIAVFQDILKKNPDSDRIHYYLGSLYEETKNNDLAISELLKINADSKLFGDAVLHVAFLHKQAGHTDQAFKVIEDASAKSPHFAGFYLFRASLYDEAKKPQDAIGVLEKAVTLFPEDEKTRYYLGSLYDKTGQVDQSLTQMEAILKLNPDNVDALNYIGYTWTVQGVRLNDAEKLLKHALALKPDNAYIVDSWGWHLFVRGKHRDALIQLEKAAAMKPSEPAILEHLGDAYLRGNLREKAAQKYSEALHFADDETVRKKVESKLGQVRQEIAERSGTRNSSRAPASTNTAVGQ